MKKRLGKYRYYVTERKRESFGERLNQIWRQVFFGEDKIHALDRNSNFK